MGEAKTRLRRLIAFVDAQKPKHLIVLGRTPDGVEREMTVDELLSTKSDFIRVLRGNDLKDVYRILDYEIPDCAIK